MAFSLLEVGDQLPKAYELCCAKRAFRLILHWMCVEVDRQVRLRLQLQTALLAYESVLGLYC